MSGWDLCDHRGCDREARRQVDECAGKRHEHQCCRWHRRPSYR